MSALPSRASRLYGQTVFASLVVIVVVLIALAGPTTVFAATITGNTYDLRLLGHVKNAAGSVLSTEGYTASPVFDVFSTNLTNNVVPTPRPPLLTPQTLRVDESEAGGTAIIWIKGPVSDSTNTFANILDPNFNVELELALRFSGLPAGKKVSISNVKPENGAHGFYVPVSVQQSGTGTAADPLRLLVLLNPADIQGGFGTSHVKLQLDYKNVDLPPVPEPATATLLLIGLVSWSASARRTRRS